MKKTEIDSILLINWYFTGCKLSNPTCPSTELVRRYLSKKVNKVLDRKERPSSGKVRLMSKTFFILLLMFVGR